jgi:hypothetical protein
MEALNALAAALPLTLLPHGPKSAPQKLPDIFHLS